MLKKTLILLFALVLFGSQAYSETVDEIINKNIKAHGGEEKYEDMTSYQMDMSMDVMGMSIPTTFYMKKPGKMRAEMSMMGQSIITVVNGDNAWISQGGQVMELPLEKIPQVKEQIEGQSDVFTNMFIGYKEKGMDIRLEGTEKIDGKDYFKLIITEKDGKLINMFIDSKTYLEYKIVTMQGMMGEETEMEIFLKSNKWVQGILIPHKIEMFSNGEPAGDITLKNIKLNEPIDDSLFIMTVPEKLK